MLDKKEKIFLISSLIIWTISFKFIVEVFQIISARQKESSEYPAWSDFSLSLISCVIISAIRVILSYDPKDYTSTKSQLNGNGHGNENGNHHSNGVSTNGNSKPKKKKLNIFNYRSPFAILGEKLIPESSEDREERIQRFCIVLFKFLYFVVSSVFGYYLLSSEPYFPSSLGGIGDRYSLWEYLPYQPISFSIKVYYHISLGYHLHSLLFHVFLMPKRNDYLEMMTHHFLATFLIVFSYMINYIRIGALVLFIHDVPDIPGYLVKASVMTPYKKTTMTIYSFLLMIWGYFRLYVFPKDIISATLGEETKIAPTQDYGRYFFFAMLVALFLMHIYWYVLFLIMGWAYASKGKTVDIQQNLGDDTKKTKAA